MSWNGRLTQWKDKPLVLRKNIHCLGRWLLWTSLSFSGEASLRSIPLLCICNWEVQSRGLTLGAMNYCQKSCLFPPFTCHGRPTLPRLSPALWRPLRLIFSPCKGWTVNIWTLSNILISEHLSSPVEKVWVFLGIFQKVLMIQGQILKRRNSASFPWLQEMDSSLHHIYSPIHLRVFTESSLPCCHVPGCREFGSPHSFCKSAAKHIAVNNVH